MIVAKPPPPEFFQAFDNGTKLLENGMTEAGEAELVRACKLCPEAWISIGCEALKDGRQDDARKRFNEVLKYAPKSNYIVRAAATNNLGMIIANHESREKSEPYFIRALEMWPHYADACANLGLARKWRGNIPEAEKWLRMALKLNPQHGQAEFSLATALLLGGKFREGWERYEARWRTVDSNIRKLDLPFREWDKTNARFGDTLMIYGEQGAGDCIQMVRYAWLLRDMGFFLQAGFQAPLVPLFRAMGCFQDVIVPNSPVKRFNVMVPIMSLPRIFGTDLATIPATVPYLAYTRHFDYGPGFHVGIVWKGSKSYKNDFFRSTRLSDWAPILSVPGVTFHSLQVADDAAAELEQYPHVRAYEKPNDFLETANRMSGLDLVITIDTSVAHLAGALAKPVWVLMPAGPDFRWLLDREDSPWYPTMRLFRQQTELQWKPVTERIANELSRRVSEIPK